MRNHLSATIGLMLVTGLAGSPSTARADHEISGYLQLDKRVLLEQEDWPQLPIYHEAGLTFAAFPTDELEVHLDGRLRFYDVPFIDNLGGLGEPTQGFPLDLLLWQAYVDVFDVIEDRLDLRIGKQRIAWGTADKFNPTDNLNPDDLTDFLDFGRKVPTWAAKADLVIIHEYLRLTAVWLPGPVPASLPRFGELPIGQSLESSFGGMLPGGISMSIGNIGLGLPSTSLKHSMQALKLAGNLFGVDWSASYFHGYDDMPLEKDVVISLQSPTAILVDTTLILPEMHVVGLDFAGELFTVGWWVEAALFIPQEVALAVTAPTLQGPKTIEATILHQDPYTKLTVGLDYTMPWGTLVNVQYVHGLFAERGADLQDYLVLGYRHQWFDEALTLTGGLVLATDGFADLRENYGVSLATEFAYKPFDNIDIAVGHVLLGGAGSSLFASMPDGDQTYAKLKASF